ncbi:hypothetical protein RFI_21799 [Reticulomyxa filosa]|uniref:Uncharacterized protein n=1 Tax=Reticulomyxa filosa TaxID=46433 RepID=X6MNY3_RETFI|nr:hypothetical protein RFI_21799 [Reticulomyxa filosa]|eukprot:ETO15564.1 hypothetical protein RFI_21799 [Reticulomyxa filosa]
MIQKQRKSIMKKEENKIAIAIVWPLFHKDDLADMSLPRDSMFKRADDALVTTMQRYSSDSKQEKESKTNETYLHMKNPRSFAQSPKNLSCKFSEITM